MRSHHTTISATNPPPANDCRLPTIVIVRTPGCRTRNRTPSAMSAKITRGRSGNCPSRRSDIARTIPRTAIADATKLNTSSTSRLAGFSTASASPASAGTNNSIRLDAVQTAEFACATRARPTSTGSAPKFAPSKNVYTACTANPTTSTCATVSTPSSCATGIDPINTALTRSADTITRRRFHRSERAPANSPVSRYGAASSAVVRAVRKVEPLNR
jgi:hypothetical protein